MGNHADLVEQVRAQQKASEDVRHLWHQYCDESGEGVRDPSRHEKPFLLLFLRHVGNGAASQSQGRKQSPSQGQWPQCGGEDLVARIKAGQKSSPEIKELWHQYCDTGASGVRNPAALDASFLQAFVDQYGLPAVSAGQAGQIAARTPRHLIEKVKVLQKSSEEVVERWQTYCDQEGNGVLDPSRHDEQFLTGFLAMAGVATTPVELVQEVKRMQKSSPQAKEAWHSWCDSEGDRVRDPSRHDAAFLERFLASIGDFEAQPREPLPAGQVSWVTAAGFRVAGAHPEQPAAKRHRGPQSGVIGVPL